MVKEKFKKSTNILDCCPKPCRENPEAQVLVWHYTMYRSEHTWGCRNAASVKRFFTLSSVIQLI